MGGIADLLPLGVIFAVVAAGFVKNIPVFDSFKEGALEGLKTAVGLLPTLIGIVTAIQMLTASGFFEFLSSALSPLTERLGFPAELVPLALIRPVSGSGATGIVTGLFNEYGPDSQIGKIASVMAASTETTFYAVAVYYSVKQYKRFRYTLPAALLGDLSTVVFSVLTVRLLG